MVIPVATEDYIAQRTTLTFAPCERVKCFEMSLVDDCVLEDTESFRIFLTITPSGHNGRIKIDSGVGDITIIDDDGMPSMPLRLSCLGNVPTSFLQLL